MAHRKVKYYSKKRRAIYAAGDDIKPLDVFERDNWICGICEKAINPSLRHPNPMCATIDHITDISKAMDQNWPVESIHTWDNVQASHLYCNLNKDKLEQTG